MNKSRVGRPNRRSSSQVGRQAMQMALKFKLHQLTILALGRGGKVGSPTVTLFATVLCRAVVRTTDQSQITKKMNGVHERRSRVRVLSLILVPLPLVLISSNFF